MRILLKLLQRLYVLYALLLFIGLMIPVFIWSLVVLPFGRIRSGNSIYRACMLWGDIWFPLVFIRHQNIFETPIRKEQSYIFVCNHISYMDTPSIVMALRKPVRPLGKVEMTKIPIFGFIYKNAIVTVDRSSTANRAKSVQSLKSLLRHGISVLVFPEGTFNETHQPLGPFYDGAFRIAIETGTPIKPMLFLDTYSRWPYDRTLSLNPGRNRCIFLDEISTDGLTLKDVAALKDKVYQAMSQKLIVYNAAWIQ